LVQPRGHQWPSHPGAPTTRIGAAPSSAKAGARDHTEVIPVRRATLIVAPLLAAALLLPAGADAATCANASAIPAVANSAQVRDSTLCLLNAERRARGLPALRNNAKLRLAATRHSQDMVNRRYFDHTAPGGVSMVTRVRRTGYTKAAGSWALGENIAWGSGSLSTPARIVRAWMHSSGHRANILDREFREIGIGIAVGTPEDLDGATYTTDFGTHG